jgi:hypothetical protein
MQTPISLLSIGLQVKTHLMENIGEYSCLPLHLVGKQPAEVITFTIFYENVLTDIVTQSY